MIAKARQLVFDLPHRAAQGRDDFLVAPANAAAVEVIDRYPDWPGHALVLVGEPGCGKSHLLEVWRHASGAKRIDAAEVGRIPPDMLLEDAALAIDNAPAAEMDERALFHLLNLARQEKRHILIASSADPASWNVDLPDLASRLKALPVARLAPPDDSLLRGVLVKLFADRQLVVDETILSYLLVRMPRALEAARQLVADIDREALETKAPVTRPLAARVLQRLMAPGFFDSEQ
jgi:chromosomal replication initiation ATPase DnaA